jgi:hypothetical protein
LADSGLLGGWEVEFMCEVNGLIGLWWFLKIYFDFFFFVDFHWFFDEWIIFFDIILFDGIELKMRKKWWRII